MKLFYSPTSPYVRKVLVIAHELGLNDRIERLPASVSPVKRDQSVVAKAPLGKVPALVLDDGSVIYDSRVIAEYLNHFGGGSFFPSAGPSRWVALTQQALADGLLDAALLVRYERTLRSADLQWEPWLAGQQEKITSALEGIEAISPKPGLTIGGVAIGCALGYLDFRFPDLDWRKRYPDAAGWYADFGSRSSFQATEPE